MTTLRHLCLLAALLLVAAGFAAPKLEAANLSLNLYQRIFPSGKDVRVSLSSYNLRAVTFSVHPADIEAIIPNTAVLNAGYDSPKNPDSVRGRLKRMELQSAVKTWSVQVGRDFYPNSWRNRAVKVPALPAGVYILQASGGGVTQRTWFAVSGRALLVKRSPDVVKAWLITTDGKKAVAGVPLALYNDKGKMLSATTGADGLATFNVTSAAGSLWIAARAGDPAFSRASEPGDEKPFRAFLYTDRPIYRPGQQVFFRGTLRAVKRGAYSLPAAKEVRVQIKTRGDAVVYDEMLPLNEWGSFSDTFQLAPEPPLGHYSIDVELPGGYHDYGYFEVEAYRKPEFDVTVSMPAAHMLGGKPVPVKISAKYVFGSPVSGATVKYQVDYNQINDEVPEQILTAAGLGSGAIGQVEEPYQGQGRLDKDGTLTLDVPTRGLTYNRQLTVRATVTDLSLRSREGQGSMLLQSAAFKLDLSPSAGQYQPGASVPVTVVATDYDNKPVAVKVRVAMVEYREDREGRTIEERTKREVTTGADGRALVTFTVERPGYYRLEAWAVDADRNPVYAESGFNVSKEKPQRWPALEISLDKPQYVPGATAKLRVRTNMVGGVALLTIEGERLYVTKLVKLEKKEFLVPIPVSSEYQPGVSIRLMSVENGDMQTGYAELRVPAEGKRLTITLTPDKTTYTPGERVTYTVTTKDASGKGVPAEVGIGVVDTALYAIRADHTPNPYNVFYPPQPNRIDTDYSLNATYPGGSYQHITAPSPEAVEVGDILSSSGADTRVRKEFQDTAYWVASVATDANGTGTVTFTLPDNLTTWRMTARSLTKTTQAGQNTNDVVVTQPLMARLVLPRFYVQGDKATAAALVHNYTGGERTVRVTLTAAGAQIDGDAERVITLPANGIVRVAWTVTAIGQTGRAVDDTARFLVSADGGPGARDAMESTVPVHPNGVRRVDAAAGATTDNAAVNLTLPANAIAGSGQVELTLSPSLAGPIFEAIEYLVGYPYGCTEQTMDRFLPDVIVTRTLKELNVDRPEPPLLKRYVNFGLQKLLRYQHDDGGWHWWENDASDPYMTAYVVYGLAMARDAGYPMAEGPLPRGVGYLNAFLADEEETLSRPAAAYFLWALAYANEWDDREMKTAVSTAKDLYANREKLDTFSKASLSLALAKLSGNKGVPADFAAMARAIVDELEAAAVPTGVTAVYWTANASEPGSWLDSNVEVTAQVLQALLAVKPNSPKIVPAVRWLMSARQGKQWTSTKDTAAAVLALTAYLKGAKELAPDFTVAVKSGGQTVQTVTFTRANAFANPVKIVIPANKLVPGDNALTLDKTGAGTLYWAANLAYTLPVDGLQPLARGVSLQRQYRVQAESPVDAGTQGVGELVQVTVTLTADQSLRYAMLSEPIPAGCEIMTNEDYGCDRRDVWDNRIVYFFDYLPKGETTVSYWLRTEAPGLYRIPPATAELLYFPDVRGESKTARMQVKE